MSPGQLGYGDTNVIGDDELVIDMPPVLDRPVVDVAAGKNHVAVMTAEGEVYAWGAGRPVARAGAFARGES